MVSFRGNRFAQPDRLIQFAVKRADVVKLRPDHKLVYLRAWDEPRQRLKGINGLLADIAQLAA